MPKAPQLDDNAPWKQRFRASSISSTQLASAAPDRGLVVSNQSGKYQLYAWDVPTGNLRQLTDRPTGLMIGSIAPDGRYVYYLDDQEGNEIGHFVRIPFEGGAPQDLTPDLPPYSSLFCISQAGDQIGFAAADAEGFHITIIENGQNGTLLAPRRLFHSRKFTFGPTLSHGSEIAVLDTTERTVMLHFSLLAVDVASGERIAELWDGEGSSIQAVRFSPIPGDLRLLATTNRSGNIRPLLWHPITNERHDLPLPDLQGDVHPVDWATDGDSLLLCNIVQATQRLYTYSLATATLVRLDHPNGTLGGYQNIGAYFGPGDEIFAQWQDATHPSQLIALDCATGIKTRTPLVAADVPSGHPWQSISFPSSDGQVIQGWLALPAGEGPFPTILDTHGGPTIVATETFAPRCQSWVDHGFAFLTINYRGSTTFGREFQEKIWGNLGHWEVEDMVAARTWLVSQGIAIADQILLTGWSYGGYNTLMALGKRPDLWAGGMAGIAIADWTVQYEDSAERSKGYQRALFGGTPQEKPEQYAASSPITYAEAVRAPVLIIQGRNDTRTPARPIELYEAKLKALGKLIEVHWFEAGHTGAGVAQAIDHQAIMLRFAHKVLGKVD